MIVPMKKASLIILGDKKKEALNELKKLGLLHIEIAEGSGEKLGRLKEKLSLLESTASILSERISKQTEQKETSPAEAFELAKRVSELLNEKKLLQGEEVNLANELERLKDWGDIDPEKLYRLADKKVKIALYEASKAEYEAIDPEITTLVLDKTKASVKFLVIGEENEAIQSLKHLKIKLPEFSSEEIRQKIVEIKQKNESIENELSVFAGCVKGIKSAIKACEKEIEFEIYATGMKDEKMSETEEKPITVAHFKGYIESERAKRLCETARANAWGLLLEDPTEEDKVPTKLKNNKFVSLIYPLTDFLGTVPGYFEYDISGWFLGFILIFFGMIFGDGIYGLLITAVAAIPIIKSLASGKKPSPMFLLMGLFGLSTMLWGLLTCTWCGLPAEQLPNWLQKLSVPVISNVYADKLWQPFWTSGDIGLTTSQNLQIFCFTLALVQLSVAHIKGAVRNRKSLKMLGDIGSILQLIGIYYLVLSLVVNPEVFSFSLVIAGIPVGTVAIALIGVGFVVSFIFANYEGSVVKSILASLADIVSVLLGVVNVFSDIVSYIRLWAVGLAGAAISATVNELAGPMLGDFMFLILAIVLLVFGHGLNMILNILSVIVHGIRLNTLEFSSHLDMSWSGHKFKPFE